jgi:hypothetical protein
LVFYKHGTEKIERFYENKVLERTSGMESERENNTKVEKIT